jgi:phosphatidylglycerol:prolipoprotein diacylglycerol transferase
LRATETALHFPLFPHVHLLFDVLAWLAGGLLLRTIYKWRIAAIAEPAARTFSPGYVIALAAGVVAGAWLAGSLNTGIAHPSHSVAGGLAGGIAAVELWKAARGISISTGAIWVGPLALGIAVGRVGCFLTGLSDQTYGTATALPWGVDFGDGVRRHPVQLYESAAMLAFLTVYVVALARRAQWTRTTAFYVFVLTYAVQRFAWEMVKPYPRVIGPLDVFQLLALGMIGYALLFYARVSRKV